MENLVNDVGKTFVEKLIDGAIAETRYVCCFTSIAEEFKEEQARLQVEGKTVGQRANVASGRGNDILANTRHWQEEANQLIQEDTKTKKKCFFGFCPDWIWRYKRGKELAYKVEKMKQLVDWGDKLINIEVPRCLPDVEFRSSQDYIHFKSRESKYKELLDALKDENNFITGLHGMGGSGKTILAQNVGKELKQSEIFTHVVDTTVSYTPNIKQIQDDIAGPLGLKWEDGNASDRPKRLWSRLTNGEKILVILDDVWDRNPPLDLDAIGIPKWDNHKGCRILVTTRNKRLLNKMGCDEIIKLEVLSKEDSQIMFERYAGKSKKTPKSLIDKGRKIVDECKGLPVAISIVASSLKGQKGLEEWDVALKTLQNPHSSIHGVHDESLIKIYNCLKFSYDYLKDEHAKGLFLLCSVFPEDEVIPVETLTRLGIGAGLFGEDYGRYNDARNHVVIANNKLLDSCLLLEAEGFKGCVKMHDLVRDAAQLIANQEIRAVNISHKDPKSLVERVYQNTTYLFLEGNAWDMFSSSSGGSKLEILIVAFKMDEDGDCVELPNSFFENMTGLRALHLEHIWNSDTKIVLSLPRSIQSLMNIRSLLVSNVDLGDISILGNLQCLETLDLVDCEINELPNEITKLEKFKLLNLAYCVIVRNNPFEVIGRCFSLEELYFKDSFNDFCQVRNFPKLQRFVVTKWTGQPFGWDNPDWNDSKLKYVVLPGDNGVDIFSEATLKYFIQTAEVLHLNGIKWQWRNLIPEIVHVDQGLNDIIKLWLIDFLELQYLINTTDSRVPLNVFSKLVVLRLSRMKNLEELCNAPLSSDSLKALEELRIDDCVCLRRLFNCDPNLCNLKTMTLSECPLLVSIFQLSTAKSLMMLEELNIRGCDQLESIIIEDKRVQESKEKISVDGDNDNKKHPSMFSKLKALYIQRCPRLEFIFSFHFGHLPVLETIIIECCYELKYIFDQFVNLSSLKELRIKESPAFIDIFREFPHLMVPLIMKEPIQLDPIKCNVFSWALKCCYGHKYRHRLRSTRNTKVPLVSEDQPQNCPVASIWDRAQCFSRQSQIMCNITKIELSYVSKIKSVFILSITPRMLLETLIISNCDELKHIVVDIGDHGGGNNWGNAFPRLQDLNVKNCGQLEYIFGHYADDHQSHNEIHLHLSELKDLYLNNLPNLIAMCPKQYLDNCTQLNLKLKETVLQNLCVMTNLFVGSKSSVTLQNLTRIKIGQCEKLEIIFSSSVVRCMPQLLNLKIEECKALKHIIEDDVEDEMMSNFMPPRTCFPKLQLLAVANCNKLKCVFPASICKELHELKFLIIREADELQAIFRNKDGQKVEIPNLKVITFVNLPSLLQTQEIQFQDVENRVVKNCQNLSLPSASTPRVFDQLDHVVFEYPYIDPDLGIYLLTLFKDLQNSKALGTSNENLSAKTSKDFAADVEVQGASKLELTSSQEELLNEQYLMNQQHPLGETDTTVKPSQENNSLEEIKDQSIQEASTSEKAITNSETRSKPPTQLVSPMSKQESFKTNVEEGTTVDNVKAVPSSTHFESISSSPGPLVTFEHKKTISQEDGDGKISIPSHASQSLSTPNEGNPSEIVESLSSSSLITWELQQLVSKKHLASENLSLLTDFLVEHPSVRLRDNSLSNRYKGYAYNCLAELLKFLRTHSVLNVLESSRSEFMELLQDARRFPFDRDWLDGVERRVLFPDLQVSQDVLEKLLHFKQQVSQHVEDLKHQLTSSEAVLESIIQQEAQVLESRAALSTPLGY